MSKSSPARVNKRTAAKRGLASLRANKALKAQADEALKGYLTAAMQTVKFVCDQFTGVETPVALLEEALRQMDEGFREVQKTGAAHDISEQLRSLAADFKAGLPDAPPATSPQADGEG